MYQVYQVGGSLKKDAPSYIERKADIQLYTTLKQGEFCYILDSRQMGKSSLLVRTRYRLEQEGYKCATVDLTSIGSENITSEQWYKGVISELRRGFSLFKSFNLKAWWKQENLSALQYLNRFIYDILLKTFDRENIVIFIDEIDSILSLPFPVNDFFAFIRFCYNQRTIDPEYNRLTFAIFGVATPSDLIQDRSRTPFNIGTAIKLAGFNPQEMKPLADILAIENLNKTKVTESVYYWTNGQPFLTQKIFNLLVQYPHNIEEQALAIIPGNEEFWVEQIVRDKIINFWQSQDEPEHLKTIRDRLLYNQQRAGRLLAIYQKILQEGKVPTDDSREQTELLLSGLVIKHQGVLQVKNRSYQEIFNWVWIEKQLSALRPYSQTFDSWINSGQKDESRLLRGQALKDAQIWAMGKSLSDRDYQFLAASVELDRKEMQNALEAERTKEIEAKLKLQRLLLGVVSIAFTISSGIGIFAFWQFRQARISEIIALASSSKGLFASNNQLDAMLDAIKAKRRMDSLGRVDGKIVRQVETALTQAVYGANEFNRLIGHQGSVLSVDISPDGKLVATGSNDKTVKIWKEDGTLLETLQHSATVHRLAFGPQGKFIVSGSLDGTVKLWSVEGELLQNIRAHDAPIWGVAFSPNGELIASASGDHTVKLWRLDGTLLATLTGHEETITSVAFDARSQIVASAGIDDLVKLWSIDGKLLKTLTGHEAFVFDVAFCQKTNLLVSGSSDRTARLWQTDGTSVATFEGTESILGVDCSDNGEYIVTSGTDNAVSLWRPDGSFVRKLKEHNAVIRDVAFRADGLMVASASDDGTVKLWQRNQSLLTPLYGHEDTVWDIAISPGGQSIVSAGNSTLLLWQSDGKFWRATNISERSIRSAAFTGDSRTAVFGTNNSTVEIWNFGDIETSQPQKIRVLAGHQNTIFAIAISPDGKTIASGADDKTIKLWSMEGKLLRSFVAHDERIWKLAFSPDGQTLASASEDGTVKLWNLDGKLLTTLNQGGSIWGVAIHPQGNLVASTSRNDTLKLWKLDGTLVRTIDARSGGVTRVAFSPDGQTIATGGVDNTVKLWNPKGELLRTLHGHEGMVVSVAFTPDGKFLVSGGDDRTVILWDLEQIRTLNELEYACDWVSDYLRTNAEVEEGDRTICNHIGD